MQYLGEIQKIQVSNFGTKFQRPWRRFALSLVLLICLTTHVGAIVQKQLPELWGLHVHDDAKVLSQQTIETLETKLSQYEDSTTNQIAILIVNSLDGESLEDYSLRVAEKWKLGQKDRDNGVLLLIAVEDHKIRIETGYGLEGVLTDAICGRIIRNEMAPDFRKDDYDSGVSAGIAAIIAAIGGEYTAVGFSENLFEALSVKERLLIGVFIFGILGVFTCIGLFVPGCGGWFLYAFLIPFYAAFPMVVLGLDGGLKTLGVYLLGFPLLKMLLGRSAWGKRIAKKMASNSGRTGTGWSSGSGWSGRSSSGSSGGFSGGGGSFGGGGSSGSW